MREKTIFFDDERPVVRRKNKDGTIQFDEDTYFDMEEGEENDVYIMCIYCKGMNVIPHNETTMEGEDRMSGLRSTICRCGRTLVLSRGGKIKYIDNT